MQHSSNITRDNIILSFYPLRANLLVKINNNELKSKQKNKFSFQWTNYRVQKRLINFLKVLYWLLLFVPFIRCIKDFLWIQPPFILLERDKCYFNYMLAIIPVMRILHLKNITCTYMSLKFMFKRELLLSTRCKYEKFKQHPLLESPLTINSINKHIWNMQTFNLVSFYYIFNHT